VNERVCLEVAASASIMPVVRMVVGGMAARVDLSVDELDDVSMALEELLNAVGEPDGRERYRLVIEAGGEALRVVVGPFASARLRQRLGEPCCELVARVVAVELRETEAEGTSIVVTKTRGARSVS
jgi:hypothetical protein